MCVAIKYRLLIFVFKGVVTYNHVSCLTRKIYESLAKIKSSKWISMVANGIKAISIFQSKHDTLSYMLLRPRPTFKILSFSFCLPFNIECYEEVSSLYNGIAFFFGLKFPYLIHYMCDSMLHNADRHSLKRRREKKLKKKKSEVEENWTKKLYFMKWNSLFMLLHPHLN